MKYMVFYLLGLACSFVVTGILVGSFDISKWSSDTRLLCVIAPIAVFIAHKIITWFFSDEP